MPLVRNIFEQIAKNEALGAFIAASPIGREFVHRVAGVSRLRMLSKQRNSWPMPAGS